MSSLMKEEGSRMTIKERKLPSDFHPDLLMDRMDLMATLVAYVHNNALGDLRRETGHNLWILGCAGLTRSCGAIQNLADEEKLPRRTVSDPGMHIAFKIRLALVA